MPTLWKLVVLLAVVLLPFGMSAAPAANYHHAMARAGMKHCPDQQPSSHKDGFGECTMACSAALPALDASPLASHRIEPTSFETRLAPALSSIDLDLATPPPRLS